MIYSDDPCGERSLYDPSEDAMYVMDSFGNAVRIPFCLWRGYYQEH